MELKLDSSPKVLSVLPASEVGDRSMKCRTGSRFEVWLKGLEFKLEDLVEKVERLT